MSSLWTPGGEHPVPRPSQSSTETAVNSPLGSAGGSGGFGDVADPDDYEMGNLTPEEEAELRAMQEQLVSVPASSVIANHVVNIFQLAMLHLFNDPPSLEEAALAIDAATAVVEKLAGRLGPDEPTLVDAIHQMRMAFIQVKSNNT